MGKSSSKKKRPKNSSSRSRVRKRSKSSKRRSKSRKLHRRDDSISYSGSTSSSSSDDHYRSGGSRSRSRKDAKGIKKRVRRHFSSSESSEESSGSRTQRVHGRHDDYMTRKRVKQRKRRRDLSVNSASSGSRTCSTCRSGSRSSSSYESQFERSRSQRKEIERSKRSRHRLKSCSSCSRHSEGSDQESKYREAEENNPRRLRSVITVLKEGMEGRESETDEHKEEIVYDRDDYLSHRSNDSNNGGSQRELHLLSHIDSEKRRRVDDGKSGRTSIWTRSVGESGSDLHPNSDGVWKNDSIEERHSELSGAAVSLDVDNLESVLRQRALENLRKFRGGSQMKADAVSSQKDEQGGTIKSPCSAKIDSNQVMFPNEPGVVSSSQMRQQIRMSVVKRNSAHFPPYDRDILDRNDDGKGSVNSEGNLTSTAAQVGVAGEPEEKVNATVDSVSSKPKLTKVLRHESSTTDTKLRPASEETSMAKLDIGSSASDSVLEGSETKNPHGCNGNNSETYNVNNVALEDPSSHPRSASGSVNSDKQQDEANESSQFEQKTMCVMRGGEMVQVSYKVKIPKKAPALARRRLKR